MGGLRKLFMALLWAIWPVSALSDTPPVRLYAPETLVETGLFRHILPRFALKTQVKVVLVPAPQDADIALGATGRAVFQGLGQSWHLTVQNTGHKGTGRFTDWLWSDVGQRTITGFAPQGATLFTPPAAAPAQAAPTEMGAEALEGKDVAQASCARCHVVADAQGMSGIGSTPSFAVLRSLPDWEERFSVFYVLKPHAVFTQITEVTPPFPQDRPPPIVPIELTLAQLDAVLAYVAAMPAADLGAPLQHQ